MPVDLREYRLVYIGPAEGQTAVAGETILADFRGADPGRM